MFLQLHFKEHLITNYWVSILWNILYLKSFASEDFWNYTVIAVISLRENGLLCSQGLHKFIQRTFSFKGIIIFMAYAYTYFSHIYFML